MAIHDFINWVMKKKVVKLNEDEKDKLRNIEKMAYIEEAEKLMKERGKARAGEDIKK